MWLLTFNSPRLISISKRHEETNGKGINTVFQSQTVGVAF
jgi:hypothetical protein